jgi:hypothetical protein
MQPIIDPVLRKYRREHSDDTAIIVKDSSDDGDSDDDVPRGPYTVASKTVSRKDIRLTEEQWNANLELEGFLTKPAEVKEKLEHRLTVTGAQGVQLMMMLKTINKETRPLKILLLPQSPALKHRAREEATIGADKLSVMIHKAREELIKQIDTRFVDKRFSDARLIQIYMSKQMEASKVLSEVNMQIAKALYLQWLRALIDKGVLGERNSPRKKKKVKKESNLFEGMDDSDDDDTDSPTPTVDRVRAEIKVWDNLAAERIDSFKDASGLIDEFKLMYAMRSEVPLHYFVFKQVSSHVAHEGNAEETFSLSGRLSNDNTKMQPGFLATLVRVNKNRPLHNPSSSAILAGYKRKYHKLPTMGDDVTDDEGSQDEDGSGESDGATSD